MGIKTKWTGWTPAKEVMAVTQRSAVDECLQGKVRNELTQEEELERCKSQEKDGGMETTGR